MSEGTKHTSDRLGDGGLAQQASRKTKDVRKRKAIAVKIIVYRGIESLRMIMF
jgi:hypothetical protein